MLHTQVAMLALAVAALAASGCGSSKSGSATTAAQARTSTVSTTAAAPTLATGAPLSRAQWIAAGDAICEGVQAKLNALKSRTTAQLERVLPQAAIYYAAEAESMGKVVPPKAMARDWQQIIDDVHLFGEYTSIAVQNINEHHEKFTPSFSAKVASIQTNMIATAKRDGFKWCSEGE
jgi:hypothetical protein